MQQGCCIGARVAGLRDSKHTHIHVTEWNWTTATSAPKMLSSVCIDWEYSSNLSLMSISSSVGYETDNINDSSTADTFTECE